MNPKALAKEIKKLRHQVQVLSAEKALSMGALSAVPGSGGWVNIVREPFAGAWQQNQELNTSSVLSYSTVFACISLIAADISKLRIRLVEQDSNGIWKEVERESPFWQVLRKPNRYQSRIQFWANWIESKLIHGNSYILKERDNRGGDAREVGVVRRLYVLDPTRVTVLVAPDGSVFYELRSDNLTGISETNVTVPASEIIHDRWNTFYHPLVGCSPIMAAGLAATQGLRIQQTETQFFASGANPGGILTAPGFINEETARRLKDYWDTNYSAGGPQVGRVAVLGDGLAYQPLRMTAADAQLFEQLKLTSETVCSVFHVPGYMVGVAAPPTYNNIEALNQAYYSQCLQVLLEAIEILMDEGLELPKPLGTEFDVEAGLFRMDTKTKNEAARQAIQSGMSPNEIRMRYFDLGPTPGGETPYLQEQQWPIRHLAERPLPSRPPSEPAQIDEENPSDGAGSDDTDRDDDDNERDIEFIEWPPDSGIFLAKADVSKARQWLALAKQLSYDISDP